MRASRPTTMPTGISRAIEVNGVRVPTLVYGTAWKEERTEALVRAALRAGFRGIDTANQRKHYHEAGVGAALRQGIDEGIVHRDDIFLQTKFTYVRGQDHRLPYDPRAPIASQVEQSFASSLQHLGVERIDSYLLHGPWGYPHLGEQDREAWRGMESLQESGRVGLLGISNVLIGQLEELYEFARVKPALVQNRTFTLPQADAAVRAFCADRGMLYEGFSLLTAIQPRLAHPALRAIADRTQRTVAEVVFRYCLAQGMVVLTGTTSETHMVQDLEARDLVLTDDDLTLIAGLLR